MGRIAKRSQGYDGQPAKQILPQEDSRTIYTTISISMKDVATEKYLMEELLGDAADVHAGTSEAPLGTY